MSEYNKCCIPYCVNGSNNKSDIKLYEFPKPPGFSTDPILHKILSRRKKLWTRAAQLQTKDVDKKRVCSDHFVSGQASDVWEIASIDWIPNKNMPYKYRNCNIKNNNDSKTDDSENSSVYSYDIKEFVNKFKKNINETSSNSIFSSQPKDVRFSRGDFKNEHDTNKKIQQLEKKLCIKEPKKIQQIERKTKNIFTANYKKQFKLKNSTNDKDDSKPPTITTKKPTKDHNTKSKISDKIETDNKKIIIKDSKTGEKSLDLKDKLNNTNKKTEEFVKAIKRGIDPSNLKGFNKEILNKVQNDLKQKNGHLNKAFIKLISQKKTFIDNNTNEKQSKNVISKETKKKIDQKTEKNSKTITKSNILKEKLNKDSKYNENIKKPNDTKRKFDSKPQTLINSQSLLNNKNYGNNSPNQRLSINEKLKLNKNFITTPNTVNTLKINKNIIPNLNKNNLKIKSPVQSNKNNKNKLQTKFNDIKHTEQSKLTKNLINNKINSTKDNDLKKPKLTTKKSSIDIGKIKKIVKESMKGSKNKQSTILEKLPQYKNGKTEINDNEYKKKDKTTVFDFMQMK